MGETLMASSLQTSNGSKATPATLTSMRRAMDSFFDTMFFSEVHFDVATNPPVNLSENDGTYTLECSLPGYRKEDVEVEARGDAITITSSIRREEHEEKRRYHRHEIERRAFARTVALSGETDPDTIKASFQDGLLQVTMRPSKPVASKSIQISG